MKFNYIFGDVTISRVATQESVTKSYFSENRGGLPPLSGDMRVRTFDSLTQVAEILYIDKRASKVLPK